MFTSHCVSRKGGTEGGGQGEVGGVNHRLTCTQWLLGLALKGPWLGPGGPPPVLTAWTGLQNTTLTCWGLIFGKEGCLGFEWVYDNQEC